jgi:2-polyprenyl-3-methyl-5-hydroxy-6-metoxy-1,4-benzoquinol methylase
VQDEYGRRYAELYRNHWWWRARERIVVRALDRLPLPPDSRILDVGCGDGVLFPELKRRGQVWGVESDARLVREDNPDRARIRTEPLGSQIYAGLQFELITALDVLEHIEDDYGALRALFDLLVPGGHLLVTVPASMALWDQHDVANQHFRRYSDRTLRALLESRLQLLELRYMFHATFVPKYLVARLNRHRSQHVDQTALPASALNKLLTLAFDAEERVLRRARLPFGTSLLAVARRAP